jgi:hypothetical protein
MQDLLQDLGVRHERDALGDAALEQSLRVALVRMCRAYEVHGHV